MTALFSAAIFLAAGSVPVAAAPLATLRDMLYAPAAAPDGAGVLDARMLGFAVILGGLALAVILLAFGYVLARRRMSRELAGRRAELSALRSALDHAEALLEAQDQITIVYRGDVPAVHGGLPGVEDVPSEPEAIGRFRGWLAADSVATLENLLAGLIERGESFQATVATVSGVHLEAQGRTAAGTAMLLLRNVSGDRLKQMHLNERFAALERELAGLRGLLDIAPTPAWIRDANGHLSWVNRAYCAAVGAADPAAAVAQGAELLGERDRLSVMRAVAADRIYNGTIGTDAGGRTASYEIAAARLGQMSAGIARDVSEVGEIRSELSRHVEAHVRTLDQINTAVAMFGPDRKLRFSNAAFRQLWQLDEAWLAAGPALGEILDALRGAGRLPEQADYRSWRSQQLRAFSERAPEEQWWHLPDGQTVRVLPQPHPDGGMTFLFDNVTEKIELQSRHQALEKLQRETLDNLNEGVALFSSNGRLRFHNAAFARLWRLAANQLDKEPHIDQVIAWSRVLMDDPKAWADLKARVTSLDDNRELGSFRFERPNGSVVDVLTVPLPGGDTLITYRDVTDAALAERALRERNEALEETDRVKTAFIRHVSYVLRAPLTTITGYAELLARPETGPLTDKQREYTGHVLTSSHSLLAIINDILDLATIDAGIMELELAQVDMADVIVTAAHGLGDRVRAAEVTLDLATPADLGVFVADSKRVTQVLFNLLANAITYSPPGGTVRVACRRTGDDVLLSVSDEGPGIPEELHASIFEPFESHSGGAGPRGAGLGLAIVKSLVDLHGGEVRLESAPGKGTTFTCVFPISPDVADRRREARLAQARAAEGPRGVSAGEDAATAPAASRG